MTYTCTFSYSRTLSCSASCTERSSTHGNQFSPCRFILWTRRPHSCSGLTSSPAGPARTVLVTRRRAPGSQSRTSPKLCILHCGGLHDVSSGRSFYWLGLLLRSLRLGPASSAQRPVSSSAPCPNWREKPFWCPTLSACILDMSPTPHSSVPSGRVPVCTFRT